MKNIIERGFMVKWQDIKNGIRDPKSVWYFIQGYVRMFVLSIIPDLMRSHIREQYYYRILRADKCYSNGSCLSCGCKTPEVFMANKGCSLAKYDDRSFRKLLAGRATVCYGEMMSRKSWVKFRKNILHLMLGEDDYKRFLTITKKRNVCS